MFTYVLTPLGSVLLFLGTTHYLRSNGRILGCSGAISTTFTRPFSDGGESALATAGILAAPFVIKAVLPELWPDYVVEGGVRILGVGWTEALAGLLVGIGTKLASGCTSGHMLCGIPRLSIRSWVSTGVFFSTAVATTNVLKTYPSTIGGLPPNTPAGLPSNPNALIATMVAAPVILGLTNFLKPSQSSRLIAAASTGLTFGLGLMVSGMTSPGKILSFLSLHLKSFDPSLALVILFAVFPNAIVWWNDRKLKQALCGDDKVPCTLGGNIQVPRSKTIDARLVLGSVIFGLGWGVAGICPGPGLIGAVSNGVNGLIWLGTFVAGRVLIDVLDHVKANSCKKAGERKPLLPGGSPKARRKVVGVDVDSDGVSSGSEVRF